jgi:LuxR family glucitol operon transcriptional activator
MTFNKRFGELLSEGVSSVARRQGKDLGAVEQEIAEAIGYTYHTIQRWRRGYLPKEPDQVAFLVRYSVTNGRISRDWVQSLLTQAHYPDRKALLQELFPDRPLRPEIPHVYQNLPPRYGNFLGREADMSRVLEGLASRWPLISIEGLGGVGKTTLVIETAHLCLPGVEVGLALPFEAVVWISARDKPEQKHWLNEALDSVARVFDYPYITQLPMEQKPAEVDGLLRAQRTLVVVDNFETIDDTDLVSWMQQVPEPSKVLITGRYAQLRSVWAIHLRGLEESKALELIRRHARRLGLQTLESADKELLLPLAQVAEGNPKAIEMALGYVKYGGLSLDEVVDHLHAASQTVGNIFDDLFARTWETLTEEARQILLGIPLFVNAVSKEALGAATRLSL